MSEDDFEEELEMNAHFSIGGHKLALCSPDERITMVYDFNLPNSSGGRRRHHHHNNNNNNNDDTLNEVRRCRLTSA